MRGLVGIALVLLATSAIGCGSAGETAGVATGSATSTTTTTTTSAAIKTTRADFVREAKAACRVFTHYPRAKTRPTTTRQYLGNLRRSEFIARRFMRRLRAVDLPDGRSRERARLFVESVARTFEHRLIPLYVQMRDAAQEGDMERSRILAADAEESLDPEVKYHDRALGIHCWRD